MDIKDYHVIEDFNGCVDYLKSYIKNSRYWSIVIMEPIEGDDGHIYWGAKGTTFREKDNYD